MEVYPKVKVRQTEPDYDDGDAHELRFPLQAFAPLPLNISSTTDTEEKDDFSPPIVRIPRSQVQNSATPTVNASKEKNIKKQDEEERKPNVKPSSVLRPRAVLSSPDNDGMVGVKNKSRAEKNNVKNKSIPELSGLKNHNSCEKRHIQCKVIPRPIVFGSPMNISRDFKESAHNKKGIPTTKRQVAANQTVKRDAAQILES